MYKFDEVAVTPPQLGIACKIVQLSKDTAIMHDDANNYYSYNVISGAISEPVTYERVILNDNEYAQDLDAHHFDCGRYFNAADLREEKELSKKAEAMPEGAEKTALEAQIKEMNQKRNEPIKSEEKTPNETQLWLFEELAKEEMSGPELNGELVKKPGYKSCPQPLRIANLGTGKGWKIEFTTGQPYINNIEAFLDYFAG